MPLVKHQGAIAVVNMNMLGWIEYRSNKETKYVINKLSNEKGLVKPRAQIVSQCLACRGGRMSPTSIPLKMLSTVTYKFFQPTEQ